MNDGLFKVSIIDGAINICNHLSVYPECNVDDAIRQLRNGPVVLASFDYEKAKLLGELAGWDAFCFHGSHSEQLRKTLRNLALRLKPFWARISYLGRKRVVGILSADQLQCLNYAGLLEEGPKQEILEWWEEISRTFGSINDQRKIEVGKEGERRTILLETERLKSQGICLTPIWVAFEDNLAGYDVLSFSREETTILEKMIEVKASSFEPTHFILTRNEWETALANQEKYVFHIWNLQSDRLIEMTVVELKSHVPSDQGTGRWESVKIVLY